ncbi:tannase/feruloyl esterase family alpha/beta hydrolase [Polymorphobacter sp. PAMC 29334]|uniref:tannase/feruloyl esterase family alpha/beta hydrolase n=1 Tax=Polymorphobacter sp. PAMC 29334 TaxID=2862331 RepID=UPI001C764B0E|nr:tannase/feruloyl esterase family alpha/beta hydrolase [Polymorphobacter sp. PAMC 29334]QYE36539.1 tannase/feruloyl esterase family alpha/beta hydrolase [Polymorphobacter sp. PAMC 29334]
MRSKYLLAVPLALAAVPAAAAGCDGLAAYHPDKTEIHATTIAAGTALPFAQGAKLPFALCRVEGAAHPTSDSDIRFEVLIPEGAGWNGRFLQVGNGGFAGQIPYGTMLLGLAKGYAVAGTDDGHQTTVNPDASWALGHPEKVVDFGSRAVKTTTDAAKAILAAYGAVPKKAYFFGCSDGGREALMTAQRNPADFDGIIAGAPAWWWTRLQGSAGTLLRDSTLPGRALPTGKLIALQEAALKACGGGKTYIADQRSCRFDPATIACKGADTDSCLTPGELKTVKLIYGGTRDPDGGKLLPGLKPGAEALDHSWKDWGISTTPGRVDPSHDYPRNHFAFLVKKDPNFKLANLTDADIVQGDRELGPILDAASPDLSAFKARGGKLIQYHGWNDPAIAPGYSLDYYKQVQAKMGPSTDFYRLFMVPGMLHCAGGDAPTRVDWFATLEQWAEEGKAPDAVVARDKNGATQTVTAER